MALEREIETYRKNLPDLLRDHDGEYVVIGGDEVAGFAAGFEDAERLGYERYGLSTPFLIKRIESEERPVYTSRNVIPCPPSRGP